VVDPSIAISVSQEETGLQETLSPEYNNDISFVILQYIISEVSYGIKAACEYNGGRRRMVYSTLQYCTYM
jgi:hypothetical protein